MTTRSRPPRAPHPAELDAVAAVFDDLPWLGLCWVETDEEGYEQVRWATDPAEAPSCARTHLLAGRRRLHRVNLASFRRAAMGS